MKLRNFSIATLITTLSFTLPVAAIANSVHNINTKSILLAQSSGIRDSEALLRSPYSPSGILRQALANASTDRIIETNGSTIFHNNGKIALGAGFGAPVYHENGQPAWNGKMGAAVYYANGRIAWNGIYGTPCYLPDGRMRTDKCYGVTNVPIGSGMYLSINLAEVLLKVPELGTIRLGRAG
jgi:hypothetical protein